LVIMIAHSEPPGWILQLRNFGTPLLVVASALSFSLIYSSGVGSLSEFYRKRFSKLVIPCWIFLCFFFGFYSLLFLALDKEIPFSFYTIYTSYTFYSGIGFLWIIQIYLIIALATPSAISISLKIESNLFYYTSLFLLYIAYEYIVSLFVWEYIYQVSLKVVALNAGVYIMVFLYGIRLPKLKTSTIFMFTVTALSFFILIASKLRVDLNEFVSTQTFKYPPRLYYLSYAILAINVLYLVARSGLLKMLYPLFKWVSSYSLWIYLWHIFFFYAWFYYFGTVGGSLAASTIMITFLLICSMLATYLQLFIVRSMLDKNLSASAKQFLNYLK
jgi:peptidoglycan/LPS O-acetylase OafA/YrhL